MKNHAMTSFLESLLGISKNSAFGIKEIKISAFGAWLHILTISFMDANKLARFTFFASRLQIAQIRGLYISQFLKEKRLFKTSYKNIYKCSVRLYNVSVTWVYQIYSVYNSPSRLYNFDYNFVTRYIIELNNYITYIILQRWRVGCRGNYNV